MICTKLFKGQLRLLTKSKLFNLQVTPCWQLYPLANYYYSPARNCCAIKQDTTVIRNKINSDSDVPSLSPQLIHHLERTSLVDFDNTEALSRLSEAIVFANQLFEVNTDGIEPLVTILENEALYLRDDKSETCSRKEVLRNASVTEEDYFVAPPGNVPLEPSTNKFLYAGTNAEKE